MSRILLLTLLAPLASAAEKAPVGELPVGANGKALNLDFETGDLRDWHLEGKAFQGQPIKGDTVHPRRSDSRSEHQGNYWIGGYEKLKDLPKGTLTSRSFKVTHPWAAFLVGGGPHRLQTCVEIVEKKSNQVILRAPGRERENMHRVVVDLRKYQGKDIFIRLVDQHTGHWGHVNFDDFRFFKKKPGFATNPARIEDVFQHQGLTAEKAAEAMTVPDGFKVIASASEPAIRQPIAMTIDDRGRIWVAEAHSYPHKRPKQFKAKDRILIFEDTNGDGKLDSRKVFYEGLNLVSGLEIGFGGVWVGQAPELLFIPDRNGDDKPDGKPEVILDGWGYHDTHETLNSFIWGPDGWLYGCHGVFTHSRVGKPGTPNKDRTPINAGIWRYHPLKKKFEVFAWGTSNPWGVDFDDHGHAFLTCCVIPHLFHIQQGGRYMRQAGSHFQPHTYADIQTIANHRHWVGNQWNEADRAQSDRNGGGHAHAGAMVYLGGAWPKNYRGRLFMNNIHGGRLNVDRLTRKSSGYEGDGDPDFCHTNDLWSQILYLRYGPDGQVYMIDWYDRNQCHHGNSAGHDRRNGRIFKIVYKNAKSVKVDLAKKSDLELVALQLHQNDWYVRHSRRLLMERAAGGKLDKKAQSELAKIAFEHEDVTRRLRGLWALHVIGALNEDRLHRALGDRSEYVRGWAVQLACESGKVSEQSFARFAKLAHEKSALVRLYLTSALQRLPIKKRWAILEGLLSHDDSKDQNLPLMLWYALEPAIDVDASKAATLAGSGKTPQVLQFLVRKMASAGREDWLDSLLASASKLEGNKQVLMLESLHQGLRGRRKVKMPKNFRAIFDSLGESKDATARTVVWALAVKFGDPTVQSRMRKMVEKESLPLSERRQFLAALLNSRDAELPPILFRLLKSDLRSEALRGLSAYDDPSTAVMILKHYSDFKSGEKRDALSTLVSRKAYAHVLLKAIEAKQVSRKDLTADLISQLRNLRDPKLDARLKSVWGTVRKSTAEKQKLIAHYRRIIGRQRQPELRSLGRAVFAKTCQQCHTLFGVGGKVGPDLTGSNRADVNYLLSNILDPSAVLGKDYVSSIIETSKGRVITGLIREQSKDSITVVTQNETIIIPRSEIDSVRSSGQSMMPENLLAQLSNDEVRGLVSYLASPRQVRMEATQENAASLFNGKDLTGWRGDTRYWKVDNGEIIGTRPKANPNRNEFLISDLIVSDFRLSFEVKLSPNSGNSGVQFRSEALKNGDVSGYQADIGQGWWGKLYEEHGRALLWKKAGDQHVKVGSWNSYVIEAKGDRLRTWINGKLCVDLTDKAGRKKGVLALQVHSGPPFEVRFRKLKLEVMKDTP